MGQFTVTDFADAVIRHEYGPFAPAPTASVHGPVRFGWDHFDRLHHGGLGMRRHVEGWDQPWKREPWHHEHDQAMTQFAPPAIAPPADGFGSEHLPGGGRDWRQQHHAGHGFFPAGFDAGVFTPPGYCLAPWECETDPVIGCEEDPSRPLRYPHYVPFMAGECATGDPMCDVTTGTMLGSGPAGTHHGMLRT
jgi:hypothetical protein